LGDSALNIHAFAAAFTIARFVFLCSGPTWAGQKEGDAAYLRGDYDMVSAHLAEN